MIKLIAMLMTLVVVAACGADDPPFRPTGHAGVTIGPNAVSTNASVGATNGTFNVGLSL